MENLKSFLDGELDLAGKAEVETHLRQDAELAKMSADFSALSGALKGVDPGQPYGLEQLQARLSTTTVAESKKIWRLATWSSVMGLLLVVAVIPLLQQPKSAAKSKSVFRSDSADEMAAAGATAAPATPLAIESSAADSMAEPLNPAWGESDESMTKGSAKKSMDYTTQERSRTVLKDKVATGGLLPAEDEVKLNMSIGKNSPGAPYGVYLEKSGNVSIEVPDLMRAVDEATGMVAGLKGFVVTSDMQNTEKGGSARMTLRIPSDNFPAAMNKLQGMGEVRQVNSASQDITGETVTSAAKTRSWADQEKQLIDELAKSKNRDEKWRIRGELSNVRANLEAEKWQLNNLKERGNFSTIEVTFTRGASGGGWAKGAFGDATSGLGSVGKVLGTLGIYLLVFIPVWLPLAIAGWMVNRRRR